MVALFALKNLKLDWVWWLVSPQNPLKDPSETGEYATRLAFTGKIARHPRFVVSDLEQQVGSRTTAETLRRLKPVLARAHFVWIMGADSFANLHHWHDWLEIPETLPLAILARPGYSLRALNGPAATRLDDFQVPAAVAPSLLTRTPPAWAFIPMPLRPESSTAIRRRRDVIVMTRKSP
ncbi:MAG: nicotinate-nicotinamide nucleotide adenylyltransferase [Rhizobiales bacterium]|nr:nicotinate-nicotinamide nucleotide adenylyltransferase [Hyphomicrobiales bacterium]MBI3673249.1 nicotinate-nicotinamide nucleotide adenylyltransferase [Hyphomicrobiales bacterium]